MCNIFPIQEITELAHLEAEMYSGEILTNANNISTETHIREQVTD